MNNTAVLIAVLGSGLCVFALRFLPFALLSGKKIPGWLRQLGDALPAAIMVILVVYCFRNTDITDVSSVVPAAAGTAATVITHLVKSNTILSVAAGTIVFMITMQII